MSAESAADPSLVIVWGDDDFAVQRRARQLFGTWTAANPGADVEIIDGTAANSEEALKALARVREALQTLPFFGGTKTIWLRGCNFAGEDRVSDAASVVEELTEFARELAAFRWDGVRMLLSAGKLDRRRAFFKTLDKLADAGGAAMESFPGVSFDDRDWREKAQTLAAGEFKLLGKKITADALEQFVEMVGPLPRQLATEGQKLVTYVGERGEIHGADVEAVVTRGRHARAFALADAVGERHLGRALRCLENELWSMQSDRQKSEIGLLYGLITKTRAMLLARELIQEKLIGTTSNYGAFAAQLKRIPADRFPSDRKFNPLEINTYVMFRAAQHARNFTREELVAAMEELLQCNRGLVGSGLDRGLQLQMCITRIIGRPEAASRSRTGALADSRQSA